ncbi:SDR family NAD(P)-dependent oxidoreductase [Stakelama saccharophila]|uniref:SDR family oxidoreductase n=1 Tax=Stakelama saccharophila TaxID=3075605 RepID=A0ABZ0B5C0_9SPHN|nr:SDR family oxidoreductase [Stakelama sp. W311]WNO52366.1 SDR family oxidoreductase [Stakelama sp. W311]
MLQETKAEERRAVYPSLKDKRVVVTGGGSGIGKAFVEGFVGQGARVAFLDIAAEDSGKLVERLAPEAAHVPQFHEVDLRDLALLQSTLAGIERDFGGIDVVVNNAANDDRHKMEDVTPEYWDERIATNLRHLFFTSQAAVPSMKRSGGGVILNLGSISWHLALPDIVLYQTSKAGIEGMTRALARDLGVHNIRVNTIIPGGIKTPRQDALWHDDGETQRILDQQCLKERVLPADVAAMALFLASDDARMCTGHGYFVDAGWR